MCAVPTASMTPSCPAHPRSVRRNPAGQAPGCAIGRLRPPPAAWPTPVPRANYRTARMARWHGDVGTAIDTTGHRVAIMRYAMRSGVECVAADEALTSMGWFARKRSAIAPSAERRAPPVVQSPSDDLSIRRPSAAVSLPIRAVPPPPGFRRCERVRAPVACLGRRTRTAVVARSFESRVPTSPSRLRSRPVRDGENRIRVGTSDPSRLCGRHLEVSW